MMRAPSAFALRRLAKNLAAMLGFALAWWFIVLFLLATRAEAHDWFPAQCCSGFDCRVIAQSDVVTGPDGFVLPGNPEIVPYTSQKIRRTPPEGEGAYALCTKGGKADGAVICLYIPDWGS